MICVLCNDEMHFQSDKKKQIPFSRKKIVVTNCSCCDHPLCSDCFCKQIICSFCLYPDPFRKNQMSQAIATPTFVKKATCPGCETCPGISAAQKEQNLREFFAYCIWRTKNNLWGDAEMPENARKVMLLLESKGVYFDTCLESEIYETLKSDGHDWVLEHANIFQPTFLEKEYFSDDEEYKFEDFDEDDSIWEETDDEDQKDEEDQDHEEDQKDEEDQEFEDNVQWILFFVDYPGKFKKRMVLKIDNILNGHFLFPKKNKKKLKKIKKN